MGNTRVLGGREGRRATTLLALVGLITSGLAAFGLSSGAEAAAAPVSATTSAGTGTTSMAVTWPASSGALNYRVKWSTSPSMTNLKRLDVGTKTSATLTGLARSTTYYVTVNVNSPKVGSTLAGVKLTPAGSTTTPAPTPPPDSDCTYSKRGIPSSSACAVLGSSSGRTDVTVAETMWGRSLGVHRNYFGSGSIDGAVRTAKDDIAHHRIPWISFKLPYSWTDMAAGKGDAWAKGIAQKLATVPGPVWVAFHHEPERDGVVSQWTALQARLAPIVRNNAPNVAYTVIVTGWTVTHVAEYSLDKIIPKSAPIDVLGLDKYNTQGTVTNGKEGLTPTDMKKEVYDPIGGWAKAHGMAWGVAETGMTDKAATLDPTWIQRSFEQLKASGGSAMSYFDSRPAGDIDWSLHTSAKQSQFKKAIAGQPSI